MTIENYKSEILFLLIGNNPLPNYVAAKLLAKTPQKTTVFNEEKPVLNLICSDETEKYAKNLRTVLGEDDYSYGGGFIRVNPSDYDDIHYKLIDRIDAISKDASIGLHYTGGTKAMSVHAYRAIETLTENAKFSYLDGRELKMRFDEKIGGEQVKFQLLHFEDERDEDEKNAIKERFTNSSISLESLLKLHGNELFPRVSENPRKTVRHQILIDFLIGNYHKESWEKFLKRLGLAMKKSKTRAEYKPPDTENREQYEIDLRTQKIKLPGIEQTAETFNSLFDGIFLADDENNLVLANLPNVESAEEFCNMLKGTWFEDYNLKKVFDATKRSDLRLGDCGSSLEVAFLDEKGKLETDFPFFEIDVVVMRGYQLFAISCTLSDDIKLAKQKLFEIRTHAEQLGGAETRFGLVCMVEDTRKDILEKQIDDKKVKVFGKDDLPYLDELFEEWFNGKD